jgi:galactokinase
MTDIEFVRSRFIKHFDGLKGNVYTSPGRINLIGEHTDYNGGFVLPGAVDKGVTAEIRINGTDDTVRAYAIDLKDRVDFQLSDPVGPKASWARYIYGAALEMRRLGVPVKGFNIAFAGDVPLGAGMSSSAAMESCFTCGLNDLFADNKVSKWDMVLAGQATEHKYCGVNCGIMDQFASVFGKEGHLMRLDCRSREFEYFPFQPKGYRLVLLDSVVKHELSGSPYNERRRSCERVVSAIAAKHSEATFETLRDCSWEQLEEVKSTVSAEDYKRARFVLGEKDRVLTVCNALNKGEYDTVGKMMYLTHEGLAKDYEVSCEELDYLNEIARDNGVTGSRIMGGGFGGCTINLVRNDIYDTFIADAKQRFSEKYGHQPKVYDVIIGNGARKLC